MDWVTAAIASAEVPFFAGISILLDQYTYHLLFLLAGAFYFVFPDVQKSRLRLAAFLISLVLVSAAVFSLKAAAQHPRPCVEDPGLLRAPYCPEDYSFPSGHTALAFAFVGASLGTRLFPPFLILSIIIALSRIYLGVHSLSDVMAGMVIGLASYYVAAAWLRRLVPTLMTEREKVKEGWRKERARWGGFSTEIWRRVAHICFGACIIAAVLVVGGPATGLLLMLSVFVGMGAMQLRMRKKRVPVIDEIFGFLERPGAMPAWGAFMYALGAMLLLSSLEVPQALAGIAVLALGDGVATLAGNRFGKGLQIFYNRKKTWAGALSFFIAGSLGAFPFIGFFAVPLALTCAAAETLDIGIDDNLLVPLAAILFFVVFFIA